MIRAMHISAYSTLAASLVGIGVALGVFVAMWTPCLCSMDESRSSAGSDNAETASQVFSLSNGLQMIRIDAASNATEMIDLKIFGDPFNEQFVRNAMSLDRSHFAVDIYLTIAAAINGRCPEPASRIRLWGNICKESINQQCYPLDSHVISFQIAEVRAAQCGNTVAAQSSFYRTEVA
jgi:hypothetical protein